MQICKAFQCIVHVNYPEQVIFQGTTPNKYYQWFPDNGK